MQNVGTPLYSAVILKKGDAAKALLHAMDDETKERCLTDKFTVRKTNDDDGCFDCTPASGLHATTTLNLSPLVPD